MIWWLSTLAKQRARPPGTQLTSKRSQSERRQCTVAKQSSAAAIKTRALQTRTEPRACKASDSEIVNSTPAVSSRITEVYSVDQILDKRPINGQQCYLVKWENFDDPKDRTQEYCKTLATKFQTWLSITRIKECWPTRNVRRQWDSESSRTESLDHAVDSG